MASSGHQKRTIRAYEGKDFLAVIPPRTGAERGTLTNASKRLELDADGQVLPDPQADPPPVVGWSARRWTLRSADTGQVVLTSCLDGRPSLTWYRVRGILVISPHQVSGLPEFNGYRKSTPSAPR